MDESHTISRSQTEYDPEDPHDNLFGDEPSLTFSNTSVSTSHENEIQEHSMNIERTAKKAKLMASLVLVLGAAASASFLWMAITNEQAEKQALFLRQASDLAEGIANSWRDYETAALWIHESSRDWRSKQDPRRDFRTLYEYLNSSGLDFFLAEWVPNITHQEREIIENQTRAYYQDDPRVNYTIGFTGLEPDPDNNEELLWATRSAQPFYFPIQFIEPWEREGGGTHLDLWSIGYEQPIIRQALHEVVPVLTPRFYLVGHGPKEGYSVVLFHPGKPLQPGDEPPTDLSNLIVQIKALLARAAKTQGVSLAAYLYDSTLAHMDPEIPPEFMGGIQIKTAIAPNGTEHQQLSYYPEIDLHDLQNQNNPKYFLQHEIFIAERQWTIVVVPSDDTYNLELVSALLGGILIFVGALLLAVWMIHNMRRSIKMHRILTEAAAEAAIVANLFPANVRERMIEDAQNRNNKLGINHKDDIFLRDGHGQHRLSSKRLSSYLTSEGIFGSKPIAELHPYTTVMFADLVGFTAWASVREPYQVFTLLEILYHSYDNIAARRRVFKVETIGDCYVAVCGLPEPRKDHAVVMSRFATDCMYRMQSLVKALEVSLGPDTGELGLRIGLHSGQVTAGVLRGDKGRFQLFGDTMNTASRIESTSESGKIQVSQECADLLIASGKQGWLVPRKDLITAKGKGSLQTYFLKIHSSKSCDASVRRRKLAPAPQPSQCGIPGDKDKLVLPQDSKGSRLISWNVEILSQLIKKIVARRAAAAVEKTKTMVDFSMCSTSRMPLDEVATIITMPELDTTVIKRQVDPECIELDEEVKAELLGLVTEISSGYHENPFHSFEHASHVTMSVTKMMSRIVAPKEVLGKKHCGDSMDDSRLNAELHDHTFGITSDPLTQFACAFSALIHDLDHQGVPNVVLMKERNPLAEKYHEKSLAEQNSIDLAWGLVSQPKYQRLLHTICGDQQGYLRFRQLIVNAVCSTDIADKELQSARKARWEVAFSEEKPEEPSEVTVNRKATIVIEHLIQASDISHTMQHWHIYSKWNQRLFFELYKAYKQGRLEKDPSVGWYEGEIGFFDFYIIPLAKKLFKCGVFGVSSDEFLNYALINRKEWEKKGRQMVEMYLQLYEQEFGEGPKEEDASEHRLCDQEWDVPKTPSGSN